MKHDTAAAKNELESYIIRLRDALESDEKLIKVFGFAWCARTCFVAKCSFQASQD